MSQEDLLALDYVEPSSFIPRSVEEAETYFLLAAANIERSLSMRGIKTSATPTTTEWKEQRSKALKAASKPMVDFVNQYCCPHDVIIIQQGSVSLYSGECAFPTEVLD